MEGLRIRIPQIYNCTNTDCKRYTYNPEGPCYQCRLLTGMREKVTTTTLTSEPKLVHSASLCRHAGGSC
jgi:hypothetical protein